MYLKLAFKNLLNQKARALLTIIGISIGVTLLVLLLALSEGIKTAVSDVILKRNPLTQITVQTADEGNSFLKLLPTAEGPKITEQTINAVKAIPYVTTVYPEASYSNISSLQINLLGRTFQTDAMIFGMPYEHIKQDIIDPADQANWQNPKIPYPAIVSRKIIDLYNLTVAPSNNLPSFSEKSLIGTEFLLLPNYSTFLAGQGSAKQSIRIKIVGFSDQVSLVGVTLPLNIVEELNQQNQPEKTYLRLFVSVDKPENVPSVKTALDEMKLTTITASNQIQLFEDNFKIITLGLSIMSFIVLLIAGCMIASTFLASVNERRQEIGILRALGATRRHIQKLFLAEAAALGAISGCIGIILGIVVGKISDASLLNALPNVTTKPATLFVYEPYLLLAIFIFTILLSVVFAALPAYKASRLKPLQALLG